MIKFIYFLFIVFIQADVVKPMNIDSSPHNSFTKIRGMLFGQTKADFYLFVVKPYVEGEFLMIYGQNVDGEYKIGKRAVAIEDYSEENYMKYLMLDFKDCKLTLRESPLVTIDVKIYNEICRSVANHAKTATYNKDNALRFHEPELDGPVPVEIYSYIDRQLFSCLTVEDDYEIMLNTMSLLVDNKSDFVNKQCITDLRKVLKIL